MLGRLTDYLVAAHVLVVIFLVVANFQAIRALSRRSFSYSALGWFAHFVYLCVGLTSYGTVAGVRMFERQWWIALISLSGVVASYFFCMALLRERDGRPRWAWPTAIFILGAVAVSWLAVQLPPRYDALLDGLIVSLGFVVLAVYYRRVLVEALPTTRRLPWIPVAGALCYATLQPLSLLGGANTTLVPQSIYVLAIASKLLMAFGLQAAFIARAAAGARLYGAAATIGRLTHELGTPIAQIGLQVERITRMLDSDKTERLQDDLYALDNAVLRVKATLAATQQLLPTPDDIIDLHRLLMPADGAAQPRREAVINVNTVVQLAMMAVKETRAERVHLTVAYAHNCCVRADAFELTQVFVNLLRNAYEAFPNGIGSVAIRTQGDGSQEKGRVVISVTDDGEGIRRDLLPVVFRDGVSARGGPGRGYGLAVVRSIVQRYGGSITLEPNEAPGATGTIATVVLPRVRCGSYA
ncbi:MAG TPA: HAMP domain-containing sensor histidine kinase [Thermoanaerobaculia bacterium]|nr:HAMP domain-containing sensor histidine kinase [Thermoanaerobaculia bacterium]